MRRAVLCWLLRPRGIGRGAGVRANMCAFSWVPGARVLLYGGAGADMAGRSRPARPHHTSRAVQSEERASRPVRSSSSSVGATSDRRRSASQRLLSIVPAPSRSRAGEIPGGGGTAAQIARVVLRGTQPHKGSARAADEPPCSAHPLRSTQYVLCTHPLCLAHPCLAHHRLARSARPNLLLVKSRPQSTP